MPPRSPAKQKRSKASPKVPGPTFPQQGSRLLSLPPELRNRIYHFALQDDISYKLRKTTKCPRLHTIKPPAPGLILACRQTHAEAVRMLYQQALFSFDNLDILKVWTKKIGGPRLNLVHTLHLKSPSPSFNVLMNSYCKPRYALLAFATAA